MRFQRSTFTFSRWAMPIIPDKIKRVGLMLQRVVGSRWLVPGYGAVLLTAGFIYQLSYPIRKGDTDMWYHLNDGRYFWEHGFWPDTPYFSFVGEDLPFGHHWWWFQPLIAKIFDLWGYQGLVGLRAILFTLTGYLAFRILTDRARERRRIIALVLFAVVIGIIELRSAQIRPHLFSYLFICAFVFLLELRPKWAFLLPLLGILWVNMHGVEWVVGALICGAYFVDYLYRVLTQRDCVTESLGYPVFIACTALSLLATPVGPALLFIPFQLVADQRLFVQELAPIKVALFTKFDVDLRSLRGVTLVPFFLVFMVVAAARAFLIKRVRIAHVVLALGGLVLLTRGYRFVFEWVLLSLPLVSTLASAPEPRLTADGKPAMVNAFLAMILLAAPLHTFATKNREFQSYPFDSEGLPVGIVEFMRHVEAKGNFLTPQTPAGYVEWALYPNVKIYADMRFHVLSGRMMSSYWSEHSLHRMLQEYDIHFLSANLAADRAIKVIKGISDFVPVFFDDAQILYANRSLVPEVADRYAIRALNPANLAEFEGSIDEEFAELERIRAIYPQGERVLLALTYLTFLDEDYAKSEAFAREFFRLHPENPNAAYFVGNIYENTGRCGEAIEYYYKSLERAPKNFKGILYRHIGTCHYVLRQFSEAYEAFDGVINPYTQQEAPEDLYQYAFSSVIVGDISRARTNLRMLLFQIDPENTVLTDAAESLLADLENGLGLEVGVVDWLKDIWRRWSG
jgi:tetratricopeptide (TPR) repeat protein